MVPSVSIVPDVQTPWICVSTGYFIYKSKPFFSPLTQYSMLIKPLPPSHLFKYSLSISLLGWNAPYIVIIFLVFLPMPFSSLSFQSMNPVPYLKMAPAHVFIADNVFIIIIKIKIIIIIIITIVIVIIVLPNECLYILELTVVFESNIRKNPQRKHKKYNDVIRQCEHFFSEVYLISSHKFLRHAN